MCGFGILETHYPDFSILPLTNNCTHATNSSYTMLVVAAAVAAEVAAAAAAAATHAQPCNASLHNVEDVHPPTQVAASNRRHA